MKTELSAAVLSAVLACASAAASELRLSLSSPDEYHFVQIPSNMVASIEGRGMVSNEATGHVPLRYEDLAFLREAVCERVYITPSYTNKVTEVINTDYRTGIVGIRSLKCPDALYAKPEAQAFTNDIVAYKPSDSGDDNNSGSNVWCTVFSETYPAMFLTAPPPSAAALETGSPLRFSDIKDCYEYVGKATRLCIPDEVMTSLDAKYLWGVSRSSRYSGLINRYDAIKGEWVYGSDSSTNRVSETEDGSGLDFKRYSVGAIRKKNIGMSGAKILTDVVASSGTIESTTYRCAKSLPIINLDTKHPPLGGRTATSVTLFITGILNEVKTESGQTASAQTTSTDHPFIVRVDAQTAAPKGAFAIVCSFGSGKAFLDEIFDKATALVYGKGGLPYKTPDELLEDVPEPPDPTGAEHYRDAYTILYDNEESWTIGYQYQVTLYRAYILYNDLKFNARVLEDGE